MTNKEQQIVDAITKQLARIAPGVVFTAFGTSYTATELVKNVAPERFTPYEPEDFPAVFVASGDCTVLSEGFNYDRHELAIKLLIFTNEALGLRPLRLVMADVAAAMAEFHKVDNLAECCIWQARSMGGSERDPVPSMTYQVRYRTKRGEM